MQEHCMSNLEKFLIILIIGLGVFLLVYWMVMAL